MLRREDYIIRVIQEFGDALMRIINKKHPHGELQSDQSFNDLFSTYLGESRAFFINADLNGIVEFFEKDPTNSLQKLNMLSNLFYEEILNQNISPHRFALIIKTLDIYDYLNKNTKEFSLERNQNEQALRFLLSEMS